MYYCKACQVKYKWPMGDLLKKTPGPCDSCRKMVESYYYDTSKINSLFSASLILPHPDKPEVTHEKPKKHNQYFGV